MCFCALLDRLGQRSPKALSNEDFDWLAKALAEINRLGELNCLFSDGRYVFAYHDRNGFNGLHYLRRQAPFSPVRLLDEAVTLEIGADRNEECGYVIATRPLTDGKWVAFTPGQLLVLRDGALVWSNIGEK